MQARDLETHGGSHGSAPTLRTSLVPAAAFVGLLWLVQLAETLFHLQLYAFGVYPRTLEGLVGVLTGPLIHGSWRHLLANTLPLLVLGTALLYGYPRAARLALPVLYVGSGLGVWLFGRASYHIGASGLAHGMMFFVFVMGILRWDRQAIALALLVFFLYGGMVWTILPQGPTISYEAHLSGAVLGVLLAFSLRNRDPRPAVKRYSWEDEDESDDAPWDPKNPNRP